MEIMPIIAKFLLIFSRVTSFFMTVPIFSYRTIPMTFKIGLSFFLSYIMYFTVQASPLTFDGLYFLLLLKELAIGLSLGLMAIMILAAIQTAGGFIDFQMGFAIANVIDPQTGAQSPIIGQYLYIFSLLFLLASDGHHLLIDGIYYSYQFLPVTDLINPFSKDNVMELLIKTFAMMFGISFQIAIPIVASMFLIDIALGIVSRTVPQLNVFVVGLPLKIFVSFLIFFMIIGVMIYAIKDLFELLLLAMRDYMRVVGSI